MSNRKSSVNKDLIEDSPELTRRVVKSHRDRLAKVQARYIVLLDQHSANALLCENCREGYDLNFNKNTLDVIKLVFQKGLPDVKEENLDTATTEQKTPEEISEQLAEYMTDKGMVNNVIKHNPKAAIQARDLLNHLLPDNNVVPIKESA